MFFLFYFIQFFYFHFNSQFHITVVNKKDKNHLYVSFNIPHFINDIMDPNSYNLITVKSHWSISKFLYTLPMFVTYKQKPRIPTSSPNRFGNIELKFVKVDCVTKFSHS